MIKKLKTVGKKIINIVNRHQSMSYVQTGFLVDVCRHKGSEVGEES